MARGNSRASSELNTGWKRNVELLATVLPRNPEFRVKPETSADYYPMKRAFREKAIKEIDKEQKPLLARIKKLPADEKAEVNSKLNKLQELIDEHVSRNPYDLEEAQRGDAKEIERGNSLKQRIESVVESLPDWLKSSLYAPAEKLQELTRGADKPTLTAKGSNIASFTDDADQAASFGKSTAEIGVQRYYTAADVESFDKIIDLQRVGRLALASIKNKSEGVKFIQELLRDEREYLVTGLKWKQSTLQERIGTDVNPIQD
jgi:hypothetical protein